MACRRAAGKKTPAALQNPERFHPRIAACEIDDNFDATLILAAMGLVIQAVNFRDEIGFHIVDEMIRPEFTKPRQFFSRACACNHLGPNVLGEQNCSCSNATAGT